MDGTVRLPGEVKSEAAERLLGSAGWVTAVFQPIAELATGRVISYEALARFAGKRSPTAAFAAAHEHGVGCALEVAVAARALATPGRPEGTSLCLNFSAQALCDPQVQAALPGDLSGTVIEITEHSLPEDDGPLHAELEVLRGRGAQIAADDAGAGYSGLKRLLNLSPDLVKLDRSLIAGIHRDPAKIALVEALVRFARRTGAQLVAEGIETEDELAVLADLDVEFGQGYFLARPGQFWPEVSVAAVEVCRARLEQALALPAHEPVEPDDGDRVWEVLGARIVNARSLVELGGSAGLFAELLEAEEVCVSRLIGEGEHLVTLSEHDWLETDELYRVADYPDTRAVLEKGVARQIRLDDSDIAPSETQLLDAGGYGSMLMLPVIAGGKPVGLFEAFDVEPRHWTRLQITRARTVCNLLGAVFEKLPERTPSS